MSYQPTYWVRHWRVLQDGGSGTWLYMRELAGAGDDCRPVFVFVEITDMVDACGQDTDLRWYASVNVVEPLRASPETIRQAIESCGWEDWNIDSQTGEDLPLPERIRNLAEILHGYGAKCPIWDDTAGPVTEKNRWDSPDESCRYFRKLRAEARRQAEDLVEKRPNGRYVLAGSASDDLDTRPVNQMGQTAREFASGTDGLWSALRRIQDAGPDATSEQALVLQMYAACDRTLGGDKIPDDLKQKEG